MVSPGAPRLPRPKLRPPGPGPVAAGGAGSVAFRGAGGFPAVGELVRAAVRPVADDAAVRSPSCPPAPTRRPGGVWGADGNLRGGGPGASGQEPLLQPLSGARLAAGDTGPPAPLSHSCPAAEAGLRPGRETRGPRGGNTRPSLAECVPGVSSRHRIRSSVQRVTLRLLCLPRTHTFLLANRGSVLFNTHPSGRGPPSVLISPGRSWSPRGFQFPWLGTELHGGA